MGRGYPVENFALRRRFGCFSRSALHLVCDDAEENLCGIMGKEEMQACAVIEGYK